MQLRQLLWAARAASVLAEVNTLAKDRLLLDEPVLEQDPIQGHACQREVFEAMRSMLQDSPAPEELTRARETLQANVVELDSYKQTTLMRLADKPLQEFPEYNLQIAKCLIAQKADVNQLGGLEGDYTALSYAIMHGNLPLVKILAPHADRQRTNPHGQTALHDAALVCNASIYRYLVSLGWSQEQKANTLNNQTTPASLMRTYCRSVNLDDDVKNQDENAGKTDSNLEEQEFPEEPPRYEIVQPSNGPSCGVQCVQREVKCEAQDTARCASFPPVQTIIDHGTCPDQEMAHEPIRLRVRVMIVQEHESNGGGQISDHIRALLPISFDDIRTFFYEQSNRQYLLQFELSDETFALSVPLQGDKSECPGFFEDPGIDQRKWHEFREDDNGDWFNLYHFIRTDDMVCKSPYAGLAVQHDAWSIHSEDRQQNIATMAHEIGHQFGLWGHGYGGRPTQFERQRVNSLMGEAAAIKQGIVRLEAANRHHLGWLAPKNVESFWVSNIISQNQTLTKNLSWNGKFALRLRLSLDDDLWVELVDSLTIEDRPFGQRSEKPGVFLRYFDRNRTSSWFVDAQCQKKNEDHTTELPADGTFIGSGLEIKVKAVQQLGQSATIEIKKSKNDSTFTTGCLEDAPRLHIYQNPETWIPQQNKECPLDDEMTDFWYSNFTAEQQGFIPGEPEQMGITNRCSGPWDSWLGSVHLVCMQRIDANGEPENKWYVDHGSCMTAMTR